MVSLSAQFWKRYSVGVKGILKNTAIKYFIREIISLSMNVRPKMTADGLQLKEVGGFYGNAFAVKNFSFTTNLSARHIAANFF
ncbi:MAG: hypothetical protein ACK5QZ_10860, partial [Bacteroidota bacterium]